MTEEQLQRIEQELNIILPPEYREVMLNDPFVLKVNDYDLIDDVDHLVQMNQYNRRYGFADIYWPGYQFAFGNDGAGNDYYMDLSQSPSPVYEADHEIATFTQVAPNFGSWVERIKREYAEFEAEDALGPIIAKPHADKHKKWWQFWK